MNQISDIETVTVPQRPRQVTVADIQAVVCDHYGLTRVELIGGSRQRAVCWPRQMAMAMARQLTNESLPEIGRRFGGRDHTTVIHACEAVLARCNDFPDQQANFDAIVNSLAPIGRAEFFRRVTVYGRFVSKRGRVLQ